MGFAQFTEVYAYGFRGKADIWKQFCIVHYKADDASEESVLNYCACNKCYKVYQLKNSNGRPMGTKNAGIL